MEKIIPKSERLEKLAQEWETYGKKPDRREPIAQGQESVWDYPRPPSVEQVSDKFIVSFDGIEILNCQRAIRICETASAPTYYFYPEDFQCELVQSIRESYCEWKGRATYWSAKIRINNSDNLIKDAFWSYESPYEEYPMLKGLLGFYPAAFESFLNGELVRSQPGGFYAGWVTDNIKGPIKGSPGSQGW